MGSTPKRGYYYPSSTDTVRSFPSANATMMGKLDTDMDTALTGAVSAGRVSGTLVSGAIPSLAASKITSGTFDAARIPPVDVGMLDGAVWLQISQMINTAVEDRTTGRRNLASLLNNVASGTVYIDRTGPIVTLSVDTVRFADGETGWTMLCQLPTGFRPKMNLRNNLHNYSEGHQIAVYPSGDVFNNRGSYILRNVFTYSTADDWPSTLPGSPA